MRINKLDGLRGICSLMVVLYHYPQSFLPDIIYNSFLIRQSWSFVDFFFVLSGFVISYNYSSISSSKDFYSYLKKRFVRIYPLLLYTTLVFFSFKVFSDTFLPELVNNPKGLKPYLLDIINTLLMLNSTPAFGELSTFQGMNFPSWSVSAEFISYFLFGITSLFFFRKKNLFYLTLISICVIVFILKENHAFASYCWAFLRGIIGFNMGCLLYFISTKKYNIPNLLEYLSPLIIVAVFYYFNTHTFAYKSLINLIVRPLIFAITILILLKTNNYISKFLESRPLRYLGKISYSVYLNHALLLLIIPRGFFNGLNVSSNSIYEILILLVSLSFVLLYSHVTFIYVESKLGKLLRNILIA